MSNELFFATAPRGLEAVLVQELATLGITTATATEGGVSFSAPLSAAYQVNLWSRVASRLWWQVGQAPCQDADSLYQAAYRLPWHQWFTVDCLLRLEVVVQKDPETNPRWALLKLKDAICDRFRQATGERPSIDKAQPDVRVYAFMDGRQVTFYLDTSGEALFKRGWRRNTEEAPLRENLAAGILYLTKWQASQPLFDPMCGSGTFLIEAAMMAQERAPGLERLFGFRRLQWFDAKEWQRIKLEARARQKSQTLSLWGSDHSGTALQIAEQNAAQAGFAGQIHWQERDVVSLATPTAGPGVLIANPPYGERLGEREALANLYPEIGDRLKHHLVGWRVYWLTADRRLPELMRLRPFCKTPLFNGPLDCRLYGFDLVAGRPTRVKSNLPLSHESTPCINPKSANS